MIIDSSNISEGYMAKICFEFPLDVLEVLFFQLGAVGSFTTSSLGTISQRVVVKSVSIESLWKVLKI